MGVQPRTFSAGHRDVAVTSTAIAIGGGIASSSGAVLVADPDNVDPVTVGIAGVAIGEGVVLAPGSGVTLPPCDLDDVFINGTAGDGVGWLASAV